MMKRKMQSPGGTRRGKVPNPSHAKTPPTKPGKLQDFLLNQQITDLGILFQI
jgi:hypothetical protein